MHEMLDYLNRKVVILAMDSMKGRITEISISFLGVQYKVRYIDKESIINEDWFYIDEIEIGEK